MDVNGTRFHLLLGERDWTARLAAGSTLGDGGLDWDAERGRVTLHREQVVFERPAGGGRTLRPSQRRGAARDGAGNWLFVGPDETDVRLTRPGAHTSETFWPQDRCDAPARGDFGAVDPAPVAPARDDFRAVDPAPLAPARLSGLAVTASHHLVVGVPSLPGLLVFDLHGGGPPLPVTWPVPFEPVDMSDAGGVLWILDRAASAPGRVRVWKLDRYLRVVDLAGAAASAEPPDFAPASSLPEDAPGDACVDAITAGMALELTAADAVSVQALPDGGALVLDRPRRLVRIRDGVVSEIPLPDDALDDPAHDLAFVPRGDVRSGSIAGRVYVADAQGDQVFSFDVSPDGDAVEPVSDYLAMRMFSGKGIVAAGRVYYDMGDRWLPLVPHRRRRYATSGTLVTEPLDSGEPACTWHRLMLDACIPAGASVTVESRAADAPERLFAGAWTAEPAPYLRGSGSELSVHEPFAGAAGEDGAGTWETLFQRARGRYLQLRLSFSGSGRETPGVWAARVYYPRFSYLAEYLPDVYREDAHSASFLDRYLANVEGLYTGVEERIANAQAHFGVATAGAEYLDWLAAWLGGILDPDWEDARRRLFLKHAVRLFSERGTPRGLVHAIRLATDECPDDRIFDDDRDAFGVRVVESFLTRSAPGAVFGDPTGVTGPRAFVPGPKWTPEEGASSLHARWRDFTGSSGASFPPLTPEDPAAARQWGAFTRGALAVAYAEVGSPDLGSYRAFLAGRYATGADLDAAWNLSGANRIDSFDDVTLPSRLPSGGAALLDWIQFVSVVLPLERTAHRFAVLVPVRPGDTDEERARRSGAVRRVVEVERPAHTAFEIKSYWAATRVGEARVGLETVVGEGSRFVPLALDRERLAHSYLPGAAPWNERDRVLVGRDRVALPRPRTRGDEHPHD